jgi:hypothetical protein
MASATWITAVIQNDRQKNLSAAFWEDPTFDVSDEATGWSFNNGGRDAIVFLSGIHEQVKTEWPTQKPGRQ